MARIALLVGLLLSAPGCIYDGAYLVEGTVRSSTASAPLQDAEVFTRGAAGPPQKKVTTSENGAYRTEYRFSGMDFLFFITSDGDPYVEFTAPGYKRRTVQLKAHETEPGLTRGACERQSVIRCYGLDVILKPVATAAPGSEL